MDRGGWIRQGLVPPEQIDAWTKQLSRIELTDLVQTLCAQHNDLAEEVCDFVMAAVSRRKIFVRRLSFEYVGWLFV
jgi:hypothetical protein